MAAGPPTRPPVPRSPASTGVPDDPDVRAAGNEAGATLPGCAPVVPSGRPLVRVGGMPITPPTPSTRPRGVSTIQDPAAPDSAAGRALTAPSVGPIGDPAGSSDASPPVNTAPAPSDLVVAVDGALAPELSSGVTLGICGG